MPIHSDRRHLMVTSSTHSCMTCNCNATGICTSTLLLGKMQEVDTTREPHPPRRITQSFNCTTRRHRSSREPAHRAGLLCTRKYRLDASTENFPRATTAQEFANPFAANYQCYYLTTANSTESRRQYARAQSSTIL